MAEQWKVVCKLKDIPPSGARAVRRGFLWQELPGVAIFRSEGDQVVARLEHCAGAAGLDKHFKVRVENGLVSLDLTELSAPASRAEAALAGSYGVATQFVA